MTPTILLDREGRFAGAIGSPGGNAILAYVAKTLVGAIDWNLPMQQALALPNLVARGANFQRRGRPSSRPTCSRRLRARGIDAEARPGRGFGRSTACIIRDGRVDGGADPRREGVVMIEPTP